MCALENRVDKPGEAEPSLEAEVGVLFVHGLGEAKRGETLAEAGEPLYNWLRSWLKGRLEATSENDCKADPICLDDTYLSRQNPDHPDAPPYATLRFKEDAGDPSSPEHTWLMAECWWAQDFPQASFSRLWNWGLAVAPWLARRTTRNIAEQTINMAKRIALAVAPNSTGLRWLASAVLYTAAGLLWVLLHAIIFLVGVLAEIAVLVLVVLAFIPPIRSLVLSIQQGLATNWGDGYVIASSPLSLEAMTTQVHSDIGWLREHKCKTVAVIAHSGGAAVSYYALTAAQSPPAIDLLVTYGNGLAKLDWLRKRLNDRGFAFALSAVVRFVAVICFAAAFGMAVAIKHQAWWNVLFLAAAGAVLSQFSTLLVNQDEGLTLATPSASQWLDFYSVADPAPNGPLPLPDMGGTAAEDSVTKSESILVSNLNSVVQDHGQYWYNNEQFLSRVARALCARAGFKAPPQAAGEPVLQAASTKRDIRAFLYMTNGFMLALVTVILWLGLSPLLFDAGYLLARPSMSLFNLNNNAPTNVLSVLLGMLMVAAAVVTFKNMVLFSFWREWSISETVTMYRGSFKRDGAEAGNEASGKGSALAFLLLSLVPPLAGLLVVAIPGLVSSKGPQEAWQKALAWFLGGNLSDYSGVTDLLTTVLYVAALATFIFGIVLALFGTVLLFWGPAFPKAVAAEAAREKWAGPLLERLMQKLDKAANRTNILGLGAVVVSLTLAFIFIRAQLPPNSPSLNFPSLYSPGEVYQAIGSYNEGGRQLYIWSTAVLDSLFPIAYASLFSLLIAGTARKAGRGKMASGLSLAAFLPFVAMAADYLENISIITLIAVYPNSLPGLAQLLVVFTDIKWGALVIAFACLLGLAALWATKRRAGLQESVSGPLP